MSKAGSLDANILLRMLLGDVPAQSQAVKKLYVEAVGSFDVADTALIEIAFVLSRPPYDFSRQLIGEAFRDIMDMPKLNCNRQLFDRVLPSFVSHPALSFEDCCLAVYAELNSAEPLWTFDKKLAKQAKQAELLA